MSELTPNEESSLESVSSPKETLASLTKKFLIDHRATLYTATTGTAIVTTMGEAGIPFAVASIAAGIYHDRKRSEEKNKREQLENRIKSNLQMAEIYKKLRS